MKKIYITEEQLLQLQENYNIDIAKARKEVNTNPSDPQKKAGNYKMGHISVNGFDITIENPKGSYRKGKDKNGKEWKIKMNNDYGYFTKTLGKDGDAIDVFLGPYMSDTMENQKIYPVDQFLDGKFDETKVMMGFKDKESAKAAYLSNYEKDWKGFKYITEVDIDTFKEWLYDGHKQRKPFAKYVNLKNKFLNESIKNSTHSMAGLRLENAVSAFKFYKNLNEGLIISYSINEVIDSLKTALHLTDDLEQIYDYKGYIGIGKECYNGYKEIEVIFKNNPENIKKISPYMKKYGYYLASQIPWDEDNDYISVYFEKKYDDKAKEFLKDCSYLYHIAPSKLKGKIEHIGILPKEGKRIQFTNPERTYCYISFPPKGILEDFIKDKENNDLTIFKIDTSKVNLDDFYIDPREPRAVYTTEPISVDAIVASAPISNFLDI